MKIATVMLLAAFWGTGLYTMTRSAPLLLLQTAKSMLPLGADPTVYAYRLRGEIRLLIFWAGKDNVGGGHISKSRREGTSSNSWNEEIEVLFGSDPLRVPRGINRWGYGREIAQWFRENANETPRLVATEFQGIMRHSEESSLTEALESTRKAADAGLFPYEATLSRVNPASSANETRILIEKEEFDYRHPEALLAKYRESVAKTPPAKRGALTNWSGMYGAPYGFLTGLSQLIRQSHKGDSRPSLTFIYNSKPYVLNVLNVHPLDGAKIKSEWKDGGVKDITRVRFRCFNVTKKTQTDFELWLPRSGVFSDIPVRILYQPRWWLRLQLDLDISQSRFGVAS